MPNGTEFLEGREALEGEYRVIGRGELLSINYRDMYWGRVKETLREVFDKDEGLADQARERLDREFPNGKQTFFYHSSPLQVAADLAGHRDQSITYAQKAAYQKLLGDWGLFDPDKPSDDQLKITHPED